jgi:VWFA-related protein
VRAAASRFRLLAAAIVLASAALAGQQAPPAAQDAAQVRPDPQMPPITFRSEVNYVEVDAVVRDAQGNFVRDLKPGELQVLEDGVPQTVTAFALVDIPVALSERALFLPEDIEPDVRSNATTPDGRLYVLLLDDLHTTALRSIDVRRAAKQFIERNLGANDLVAVVHTSGRGDAAQDFTNSRARLIQAVEKFMGREVGPYGSSADRMQVVHDARSMFSTLRNLCDWLSGIRGRRKAVVFFSEGIPYDIWSAYGALAWPQASSDVTLLTNEMQDATGAATRANVNIYSIDPRGLTGRVDDEIASGYLVADQNLLRSQQDSLRVLADETGGFAALTSNDFAPAFQRIVDENSSYYVLGYYSTNEKRDGRFRRIDVRMTRPGLRVNARKGYDAPRGKPAPEKKTPGSAVTSKELRETMSSPLQVSELKLAVFAAAIKGPSGKATVAIVTQFLGSELAFKEKDGKFANALEVSYMAVDKQGKVAGGNRDKVDLSLKPETYRRVLQAGVRVQNRLELAPGQYQLRVAAREEGGKSGSVHYDLTVPDFAKAPTGISGLFVSSLAAGAVPTVGTIPELESVLQVAPTTARTFRAADELSVLGEIYDNQGAPSHAVDITCTLKAEGRVNVFSNSERRSSKELGGARGGYGYAAHIPLKDLAPGLYVLRVEAKSSLSGAETVAREVQIRIVP